MTEDPTVYVACENQDCGWLGDPKDSGGFDPAEIRCGGCGGPVAPIERPR